MSDPRPDFQLVLTTAGSDEQALAIARGLVERRLAACVNVAGNVCSIYLWKGKVVEEGEKLLLIKTEKRLFAELCAAIREGRTPVRGATFADGLANQIVLDAVRISGAERRWVRPDEVHAGP